MEQQGVGWSTDEVSSCFTMEQFLDYLELRVEASNDTAAPATTCSKSWLGAPPLKVQLGEPHIHGYWSRKASDGWRIRGWLRGL